MKIAMVNDVHFGVRNDSPIFRSQHEKFFTETFFPVLKDRSIDTLVVLGDIFDRRKYINFATLHHVKKFFFDTLRDLNIYTYILVGNHDVFFKNTNEVNSPELLLGEYSNVEVITEPTVITEGGFDVALCPWINSENYTDSINFLQTAKSDILLGHFEITGFEMHKGGGECHDGMDPSIFNRYEFVFSGHFHHPSTDHKGIYYLGAPAQFTWADFGCRRGFHLFDLEKRHLEFIENPNQMFVKIFYDEDFDILEYDYEQLTDKIVRILVGEKEVQQKFDLFIDKVQQVNPYQLDIVDNSKYHFSENGIDEEAIKSEDTMSIVNSYIEGLDTTLDPVIMKDIFKQLYLEALVEEEEA